MFPAPAFTDTHHYIWILHVVEGSELRLTPYHILKCNPILIMAFSELTAMCHGTNCFCKARCESPDSVMETLTKPVEALWFRVLVFL